MSELPRGWARTDLGAVLGAIEAGKSFKCEERPPSDDEVGVVKVSAVSWGEFDESESKTCQDPTRIDPDLFVRDGDLLFSRANTIELVGACVIVGKVSRRLMLSDKILRFRLVGLPAKWVLYILRSRTGRMEIERLASGNQESMRNIGQDRIRSIQIPIAPILEIQRILTEVESYITRLNHVAKVLERVQRNLKRYRASVLKAAVEGRLVPTEAEFARVENRDYEPASVLLKRILAKGRQRLEQEGRRGKYDDAETLDTKSLPELPTGWCWARIESIADVIDPQPSHRTPSEVDDGVPYVGMSDISEDGQVRPDTARRVDVELLLEHRRRYTLRDGDFVFGKIGTLGRPALLPQPFEYTLSANLVLVQSDAGMVQRFLFYWMQSPLLKELVTKDANSTSQPAIGIKKVRALPVPIPPLREQERIIATLDRQLSFQIAIKEAVDVQVVRISRLRHAILKWAFEGKLVDQDPNDEPASALLARIKGQLLPSSASVAAPRRRSARKS